LELLQRFQLFTIAAEVLHQLPADHTQLRQLNQKSTCVYLSCPLCKTPQEQKPTTQRDPPPEGKSISDTSPSATNNSSVGSGSSSTEFTDNRVLVGGGSVCTNFRCRSVLSTCAICEEAVRGVYVWCQGCGHGGHIEHMENWFSTTTTCPTGCLHQCLASVLLPRV